MLRKMNFNNVSNVKNKKNIGTNNADALGISEELEWTEKGRC